MPGIRGVTALSYARIPTENIFSKLCKHSLNILMFTKVPENALH
jgi:hypothetical protein